MNLSSSIDKYGFLSSIETSTETPHSSLKLNARIEKWLVMIENWDYYSKHKHNLIKSRVRKGIPDMLRSRVWLLIARGLDVKSSYARHLYFRLCNQEEDPDCIGIIEKDLNRTYPNHELFKCNLGQDSLRNILRAYAFFDPEVGYCQGMAYVVGIIRMYMDEESAFWLLVAIMNHYDMRSMFKDGLDKVYQCFYKANSLLKVYEPSIWKKLKDINFTPQIYSTQWFMTIYANFPIETRLRIWDCFLCEGPKILFRIFVGFFRMNRKLFKNLTFENTLKIIRNIENDCDQDELLDAAFSINLSKKRLVQLEKEYAYKPKKEMITW